MGVLSSASLRFTSALTTLALLRNMPQAQHVAEVEKPTRLQQQAQWLAYTIQMRVDTYIMSSRCQELAAPVDASGAWACSSTP